jgi:hypothetical protein
MPFRPVTEHPAAALHRIIERQYLAYFRRDAYVCRAEQGRGKVTQLRAARIPRRKRAA